MSHSVEPARQPAVQSKDERSDRGNDYGHHRGNHGGKDRLRRGFEVALDAALEAAAGLTQVPPGADRRAGGHEHFAGLNADASRRRVAEAIRAEAGQAMLLRGQAVDLQLLLHRLPQEDLHLRLAHGALAGLEIQVRRRGEHLTVRLKHEDRSRAPQVAQLCAQISEVLGQLLGRANVDVMPGDAHVAPTR